MSTRRREGDVHVVSIWGAKLGFALGVLVTAVALAPAATFAGAPTEARLTDLETAIVRQLNSIRAQHDLAPLRVSPRLAAAAAEHSREMAERGYFAHGSADGSAFWRRIQRFYPAAPSQYWSVGENLLWSTAGLDAVRAVDLWMASPGHRENILTGRWREIGVAAVDAPAGAAVFGGREVTLVTTDFGVRA